MLELNKDFNQILSEILHLDNHFIAILGPVASSKTKLLVHLYRSFSDTYNVIALTYEYQKSPIHISSRDIDDFIEPTYTGHDNDLSVIFNNHQYDENTIFLIDEIQFFPNALDKIIDFRNSFNTRPPKIIVFGLDKDFRREWFTETKRICKYAIYEYDCSVYRVLGKCTICGCSARYSKRLNNDKRLFVPDKDLYETRCLQHFIK